VRLCLVDGIEVERLAHVALILGVGNPLSVGGPHGLKTAVGELVGVDEFRLAIVDREEPEVAVLVGVGDALAVGRPLGRVVVAGRRAKRKFLHVLDAVLVAEFESVLTGDVGEVGDPLSVGRPGRLALGGVGGVGQVADVALLGGNGEDLAMGLKNGPRTAGRDVVIGHLLGIDLYVAGAQSREVAANFDVNRPGLVGGNVIEADAPELLVHDAVGAGGSCLEVEACVLDDLLHGLRSRVIGEERHGTVAIGEEVNGAADPHGVEVVRVVARNGFDVQSGEVGEPDVPGLTAAVTLPGPLPLLQGDVGEARSVGGVRSLGGDGQREFVGESAGGERHSVKTIEGAVAVASGLEEDFAVGCPSGDDIVAGMEGDAPGDTAVRGDHIDVTIALDFCGVGDHGAVGGKGRMGHGSDAGGEPAREAAAARDDPEVAGIGEGDLRFVEGGAAEKLVFVGGFRENQKTGEQEDREDRQRLLHQLLRDLRNAGRLRILTEPPRRRR